MEGAEVRPADCPDGLDCPNWEWCEEFCTGEDDPCPLRQDYYLEPGMPLDKVIKDA
jgi:hypothetical protein